MFAGDEKLSSRGAPAHHLRRPRLAMYAFSPIFFAADRMHNRHPSSPFNGWHLVQNVSRASSARISREASTRRDELVRHGAPGPPLLLYHLNFRGARSSAAPGRDVRAGPGDTSSCATSHPVPRGAPQLLGTFACARCTAQAACSDQARHVLIECSSLSPWVFVVVCRVPVWPASGRQE